MHHVKNLFHKSLVQELLISFAGKRLHRPIIIDFPNLRSTYNGGWCTATETGETLRPICYG